MKILKTLSVFLFTLVLTSENVHAQRTSYVFFDYNWKQVYDQSYSFYRIINFNSAGQIINPIKDYYRNGAVQCVVYCDYYTTTCGDFPTSCGLRNGEVTWYNQNGQANNYRRYKNGSYIGFIEYGSSGTVSAIEGCTTGDCDNGYGTYYYKHGDKYIGYFKNGYRHGQGTYTWGNTGRSYAGLFKNGEIDKPQNSNNGITMGDVIDGLEIAIKLVELYKAVTK